MSAITYHYDGSPCPESCPCASREVERLRAQLEAVTRDLEVARIYAADREGLALQLDAARETIQFGIELRQKAERERDEARESEARMRAAAEFGQKVAEERGVLQGLVYWRQKAEEWRAALSAPAPEPSERMMRVAEAVLTHFTTAFAVVFGEPAAEAVRRAINLRAIVAKVTP